MKECCTCKQFKPLDDFSKNKATKDTLNKRCKTCHNTACNKFYRRDPENSKRIMRRQNIRIYWPHLSLNDALKAYEDMKQFQNNACAICKISLDENEKRAYIDHDHDTGKVRGLLCSHCNSGLGFFKDNLDSLENAKNYLIKSKA